MWTRSITALVRDGLCLAPDRPGLPKYIVAADTSPDDLRLTGNLLVAVGESCSAITCPRNLEDSVMPLNWLHARAAPCWSPTTQVFDKLSYSRKEGHLGVMIQSGEFPPENALPFVCRHVTDRRQSE